MSTIKIESDIFNKQTGKQEVNKWLPTIYVYIHNQENKVHHMLLFS